MKKILGHKWAVGISAAMLVLALGAVSWAADDDQTAPPTDDGAAVTTPAPGGFMFGEKGKGRFGKSGGFGHRGPGGEMTEEMQQAMEERGAEMDERRDAFLQEARSKMTAEEQQSFDALNATAETQREALDTARDELRETMSKVHDLIKKYYPDGFRGGPADDAGPTGTTGATPEETSSTSI
ncbi:MAG: hypothetical protein KKA32_13140 [Actinobacteria bacterium]|nr:hypothetical protein [Actinomycetota bacterium]